MSLPPSKSPTPDKQTEEEAAAIRALVDSFAKSNVDSAGKDSEKASSAHRPMRTYTREQLLYLSASPLVQLPPNMPELKQWFGDNEILLTKKDSELTTPNNGRDRRFRREPEDGEISSRPSFRSTLSQPSQMGNFKHQSLRSGDRDKDRERDGDRDKDNRDKEGLRHLSDKYDRDRLVLLPAGARGKERESAPHLNANSSSRTTAQNQSSLSGRRGDARDAQKKRAGESGDDWRRNDASRSARDDRDDRERARSRARESSRSKRSPSRPRREKDDGKDRSLRNDRDRGDYGREDYRRERENDRDQEDDPRRWRDDGKRDERVAARRAERDRDLRATRERERGDHWEPSSDRRWTGNDDRDGRYKRTSTRDRKSGGVDELKDRDERREREKEQEPAWMETYVPSSSSGILGGKSTTGELDGIQAWKKGLKEKELALEERNAELCEPDLSATQDLGERGLDEIQLFKMLMRREEEKKKTGGTPSSPSISGSVDTEPKLVATNEPVSAPSQPGLNVHPLPFPNSESSTSTSPPFTQETYPNTQSSSGISPDVPPTESSIQFPERPIIDSHVYNPPTGSRLLALGRTSAKSPVNPLSGSSTTSNGIPIEASVKPGTPRAPANFSPFEEQLRLEEEHNRLSLSGQLELNQQPISDKHFGSLAPTNSLDAVVDGTNSAYAANKGSRFAKFFDNKPKETPGAIKSQTPTGYLSSSPNPPQRQEHIMLAGAVGAATGPTERTMDDIFAMLNNSSQAQRANMLNHPTPHHPLNDNILNYQANALNNLPPQPQSQHPHSNSRLDALYDSHLDDRNFVPDGMVPGLRPAPPPRSRDNVGLYPDSPDEALQFHLQRLQQQQHHRGHDTFVGPSQSMYGPQNGRSIHQAQFRGGPSPGVGLHSSLPNLQPQRLPPGLANLGGRPPHDPVQLLGLPGHPNALHANLHPNASLAQQQTLNNFAVANNLNYNNLQLRGPIPNIPPLQNAIPHSGLGAMGLTNNIDLRSQNPTQLLGIGGPNMSGPRGTNMLFNPPHSIHHLQGPHPGVRQQQAHLPPPPHAPLNIMPPHLQQQPVNGSNNGHANELIALLMGGPGLPRE